jgi:hypothetical protein
MVLVIRPEWCRLAFLAATCLVEHQYAHLLEHFLDHHCYKCSTYNAVKCQSCNNNRRAASLSSVTAAAVPFAAGLMTSRAVRRCCTSLWACCILQPRLLLLLCLSCRADDESDRQALLRQQNKMAALEVILAGLKVRRMLCIGQLGSHVRNHQQLEPEQGLRNTPVGHPSAVRGVGSRLI